MEVELSALKGASSVWVEGQRPEEALDFVEQHGGPWDCAIYPASFLSEMATLVGTTTLTV